MARGLFDRLRRALGASAPTMEFVHSELGTLRYDHDSRWWQVTIDVPAANYRGTRSVTFVVAGDDLPDRVLVAHAVEVTRAFADFEAGIRTFLAGEAASERWFGYESEVAGLTVESLNLLWPSRPDDGMIYFDGGLSDRVWRCDYASRAPSDLGFDR